MTIGVSLEFESHALRHERAEALPDGASEMEVNRVFWKSLRSKPPDHLAAEDGADDAIGIAYIQSSFDLFLPLQSRRGQIEQNLIIELVFKRVILRNLKVVF